MNISNKDLEILQLIERYLYSVNEKEATRYGTSFAIRMADIKDKEAMRLYLSLYQIIEKLLGQRNAHRNKTKIKMAEKRQEDKMYGRSFKEKERMQAKEKERMQAKEVD